MNAYLAGLGGDHPADLAGLIAFNNENAAEVLEHFGQELFEAAEATSGDLADPAYREARTAATGSPATALDGALRGDRLDAVIALTGHPAWLTDHVLGDYHGWGTSSPPRSPDTRRSRSRQVGSAACRSACPSSGRPGASRG